MTRFISINPVTVPNAAIQKPSTSSCCASRRRLAPSATRTAISATPGRGSREQQAGDIRAGDRQDQSDRHEEHSEEGPDGRHAAELFGGPDGREERNLPETPLTRNGDCLTRRRERRPRRCQRLVVAQPPDELNRRDRARAVEIRHQGPADGQVDFRRQPESRDRARPFGDHASHRVWPSVEDERAADDGGILREALLPETMADHDDRGVELGLGLPRREAAPELHRHADHVEEIPRHRHGDQVDRPLRSAPVGGGLDIEAGQAAEGLPLVERAPLTMRDVAAAADRDVHETVGTNGGRLREQQLAGEAEDRRVGGNRDADGQRRGRQQQRLTNQRAQRVAQIVEELLDEGDAAGIPALLLDEARRTEGPERGRARLGRGHACGDVLVDLLLEVERDLLLQRLLGVPGAKQRRQAQANLVDRS